VTATCRTCHAPIIWAANETTGRLSPLDAELNPEGNCVLTGRRTPTTYGAETPLYVVRGKGADGARTNHFSTCPQAAQHRRSKRPPT
jgi:hypothetical protein